jgi:ATP-dependent helicase HepA
MDIDKKAVSVKIPELLHISEKQLSTWLKKNLSSLDEGWWKSLVLPTLSYQQKQKVDRKNISDLDGLDLAALLRVFDQNWYQFTRILNFPTQDRHYVKEMQTIRNRWAHIDTQDFNSEDVYRDIDTLQRFLQILTADDQILSEIKQFKNSVLLISLQNITLSGESEEIKPK